MVEPASTFLMSSLAQPIQAPNSSVTVPTMTTAVAAASVWLEDRVAAGRPGRRPAVTMVAAWISADTGVGPSIASSSQDCSGTWADLPQAPSSSSRPITVAVVAPGIAASPAFTSTKAEEPKVGQHQHDRHRHAQVTDPVDHEGLLGRRRRGRLVLPEADQQVRGQADALPADEQHQVVVGEHQQQHRGDEQVEEPEEAAPPLVVGHVADRVDVDQAADAGDQQHEQDRQLVDQQPDARCPSRPVVIQV